MTELQTERREGGQYLDWLRDDMRDLKNGQALHEGNDQKRHDEVIRLIAENKKAVEIRVTSLETTRTEKATERKTLKWVAGSALALAGLPWIGKAFAKIGELIQ